MQPSATAGEIDTSRFEDEAADAIANARPEHWACFDSELRELLGFSWAMTGPGRSRDSDELEESNWDVILTDLRENFCEDEDFAVIGSSHWAVGWVDELATRVYDPNGTVSQVFARICEFKQALEDYPVLDEEDFSRREHDAVLEELQLFLEHDAREISEQFPEHVAESVVAGDLMDAVIHAGLEVIPNHLRHEDLKAVYLELLHEINGNAHAENSS